MDSADSIPDAAWDAVDKASSIPMWMWAAGAVTGLFGILVLVFPFCSVSFEPSNMHYLELRVYGETQC